MYAKRNNMEVIDWYCDEAKSAKTVNRLSLIHISILGECALSLENEKNAREKEEAAILAKNEQLRANLLRAISHDLRTPLTSISGNASNLISNGNSFDEATKNQLYTCLLYTSRCV